MKKGILILLGFILSLIGILILAHNIESGDINAVSMYFVVDVIPAIGLSVINGFFLNLIQQEKRKLIQQIFLGLIPLGILTFCLLFGDLKISFIGEFGLLGIGTTNMLWVTRLLTRKINL